MKPIPDPLAVYKSMMEKAVFKAHYEDPLVVYLFDENRNEIGFYPVGAEQFAIRMSRKWNQWFLDKLVWTKIK